MRDLLIRLGDGMTLPLGAVTETFAILANRGAGKSSTARVLVEELSYAGQPVVVLDVKGDWWGLRSSAGGDADGLPFVIFGGRHADVPLEPTAGRLLGRVLVDTRQPAVLDLSAMSRTKARGFTADFAEELYLLNQEPLHLVVDEADVLIPQRASAEVTRLLEAMEDVAKRGRQRGLGMTVVSQRAADVSKTVLDVMETLVPMRVTGPKTRKAILDWINDHAGDPEEVRTVIASLSRLETGQAWVWSPGWLRTLRQVRVRPIHTFDSHATPTPGQARARPQRMAAVDLAALGEQITATVERANQQDPKVLLARIADLQRRLAAAEAARPEPARVEVPVLTEADLVVLRAAGEQLAAAVAGLDAAGQHVAATISDAAKQLTPVAEAIATAGAGSAGMTVGSAPAQAQVHGVKWRAEADHVVAAAPPRTGGQQVLPKAQWVILTTLAQHGPLTTTQVAMLTRYSHTSGGFRNALSSLRSSGYIEGRGTVSITPAGLDAHGPPCEPLPTGRALIDFWKHHHLGKAERAILDVLVDSYPDTLAPQVIASRTGYSHTSGGFRNALSRLRTLELAQGRGVVGLHPRLAQGWS